MKTFRRRDGADPSQREQALISEGHYQQDPRDFPVWHADIARENRRARMNYNHSSSNLRDTLKWIMLVALLLVFALAMWDAGIF